MLRLERVVNVTDFLGILARVEVDLLNWIGSDVLEA